MSLRKMDILKAVNGGILYDISGVVITKINKGGKQTMDFVTHYSPRLKLKTHLN